MIASIRFCVFSLIFFLFQASNGLAKGKPISESGNSSNSIQSPDRIFFSTNTTVSEIEALVDSKTGLSFQDNFSEAGSQLDAKGNLHRKFRQVYKNYEVEGALMILHSKGDKVYLISSNTFSHISCELKIRLTSDEACSIAKNHLTKEKNFIPEKVRNLGLVIVPISSFGKLCYKIDCSSPASDKNSIVYVDAENGEPCSVRSLVRFLDVPAHAHTYYNGWRQVTVDSAGVNNYKLQESGRNIRTMDQGGHQDTSYATVYSYPTDSLTWDDHALDLHFNAEACYDYFLNQFGRHSYDNLGSEIINYYHSSYPSDAYWNGTAFVFGDGFYDQWYSEDPRTALPSYAHEFTHAFLQNVIAFSDTGEAAGLEEAISNMFAIAVDFSKNPTTADYRFGDEYEYSTGNDLSNPGASGWPSMYTTGIGINSSVAGYWFYLLSAGRNGVNEIGQPFSVHSIGIDTTMAIVYHAILNYLTPTSNYLDFSNATVQSAIDLFGPCSDEVIQVKNAWYAVGIGTSQDLTAGFISTAHQLCTTGFVRFQNTSVSASSYAWNFGDSNTSSVASPTHTYASAGTYVVRMIAQSSGGCISADTLTDTLVVVSGGPTVNTCIPLRTRAYGRGISSVTLQYNFTVGPVDQCYSSYMCNTNTTLIYGDHYAFRVGGENMYVKAWLDFNNDGSFSPSEIILSGHGTYLGVDSIIIPATAEMSRDITLRIVTDSAQIVDACQDVFVGQIADYRIRIVPNTFIPQPEFTASSIYISPGDSVSFTDHSLHAPDHWSWSLSGAVPDTSTLQNPTATYYLPGVYPVTLTVSNQNGSASVTDYIHVEPSYVFCVDDSATSLTGMISDLNSPPGSASSCSFLIAPSCANSITISFTLSDIYCYVGTHIQEYDYLWVYDGDNTSAPLLLISTCDEPISPVTALSGKALIRLSGYTSESFFTAHWETNPFPTQAPNSEILVSDSMPPLLNDINFTSQCQFGAYGWWWNFGDGTNSQLENPTHAYQQAGNYQVTLITTQCNGGDTVIQTIHVQAPPVPEFSTQSISESLACNDSLARNLYLKNTGAGDLTFYLSDSLSVPQWVNISPLSGLIHPGDSLLILVRFNSSGILGGNYSDSIFFHTNEPLNPDRPVYLGLSTSGSAIPALSANCLSFNSVVQYTTVQDSVKLYNLGCDTLHLLSWQFSNSDYSANANSQLILPGDSTTISVHFNPTVFGSMNDTLTLFFQTGSKKICLNSTVLSAPAISAPIQINHTLSACSGITTGTFYLHNNGGSTLQINSDLIDRKPGITTRILLLKDTLDYNSTYTHLKAALIAYPGNHTLTELTQFAPANLSTALASADIFIVPYTFISSSYFTNAASVLDQFVKQGGVVIFNAARDRFAVNVTATGLLHGIGSPGYQATVGVMVLPNHPILQGISSVNTNYEVMWPMNLSDPDLIHIVKTNSYYTNTDLVACRKIERGKVIYIGNAYFSPLPNYNLILNNAITYGMSHEFWLSTDTISVNSIVPGDSIAVNYSIDVTDLSSGTYTSNLLLYSSDPLHLLTTIPFTINVSSKPCADFFAVPDSCNGSVSFTDKSLNAPTSWSWDFGDGSNSTLQNPVHQYSSGGTNFVTLITCNASDCDTSVIPVECIGPFSVSTQCNPVRSGYSFDGITHVVFNTIDNLTPIAYYNDYTCTNSTIVYQGGQYALTVERSYQAGVLRAWIDYDNDGLFTNQEEVAWNINSSFQLMEAKFTISNSSVTRTPLRMRICEGTSSTVKPLPCDTLGSNKYQDYTVYVIPDSVNPIASFTYSVIDSCLGIIQFYNHSQNSNTYFWDFGNGLTSTDPNPLIDYDSLPGNSNFVNVNLTVANSVGFNTAQQLIILDHFLPKLSILSSSATILCPGHTIFLYAPFNSQIPYHDYWLYNDTVPFNYNMDNLLTDSIGSYSLVYSNSYCADTTDPIVITGISDFQIQTSLNEACEGDSIQLTGPPAMLSYQWSTGETTQSIYADSTGSYALYSTVQPTCFANDTVSLLFHPLPASVITYLNDTLFASSGAISYQWYFNGTSIAGATQDSYHPTANGPYSVLVTDNFGCSSLSDTMMYLYAGLENRNQLAMSLFPNPANESIEVYFTNTERATLNFKIIALPGNTVSLKEEAEFPSGTNSKKFNVSDLTPGVYVFLAESKSGVFRQRVVIAR